MWTEYFDEVVVLNLDKRVDRLLETAEELEKYNIPYKRIAAIEHENGAEGLKITLENILKDAVERKLSNILIFEDDVLFKENPTHTMEQVIKQTPEGWHIIYLGGQVSAGFHYKHSPNLFQLDTCYATHAWAISLEGMKQILSYGLYAPIDNCLVDGVQKMQKCYITYPLLATQRAGMSNIGGQFIDWDRFITPKYNEKLSQL
jgi:GR25 family glycosyltransferase involved in LPS biosynthesis